MKFCKPSDVKAGDLVNIDDLYGEVMFNAMSDSYGLEFPKTDWPSEQYQGIMIRQENGALIFHEAEWFTGADAMLIAMDDGMEA
jgi:hypothetical protein